MMWDNDYGWSAWLAMTVGMVAFWALLPGSGFPLCRGRGKTGGEAAKPLDCSTQGSPKATSTSRSTAHAVTCCAPVADQRHATVSLSSPAIGSNDSTVVSARLIGGVPRVGRLGGSQSARATATLRPPPWR